MTVRDLHEALVKMAAGELESNEDEAQQDAINNVYPEPEGREDGLNAQWGDNPAPQMTFGTATMAASKNVREGMLTRLFDAPYETAKADKALISTLFNAETVRAAVPPHSVLLRHGEKTAAFAPHETLGSSEQKAEEASVHAKYKGNYARIMHPDGHVHGYYGQVSDKGTPIADWAKKHASATPTETLSQQVRRVLGQP